MLEVARAYMASRKATVSMNKRLRVPRAVSGADFSDLGPRAIGRLVVETQEVDAEGQPIGEWKTHVDDKNLVVRQAEQIMADMSIMTPNSGFSYIELGDPAFPATPPSLSDVGLQASTGVRKALDTLTKSGNVVTAVVTFLAAEANGNTYTEAGLFNGLLGSGLIFARKVFNAITKTNSFQMRFTWYITFLVNTQGGDCSGVSLIGPSTVTAFTVYDAAAVGAGGQASVAANFDFTVGANHVDVFLRGQRLVPGLHYQESATLNAVVLGPASNKGINLTGFSLIAGDEVFLIQRSLA